MKAELSCFVYHYTLSVYDSALTWKILHKVRKRLRFGLLDSKGHQVLAH